MADTAKGRPAVERTIPPKATVRVGNPIAGWLLPSLLHGLADQHLMLLPFRGRKSARRYTLVKGRRNLDGILGILSSSWRLNLRGGAGVELALEGEPGRGHGELVEDPNEVARLYGNLIEEYGLERTGCRLGFRINDDRAHTHEELVDAVRWSGLMPIIIALDGRAC